MSTVLPESHLDLLTRPLFGHLATTRPDGTPQVNPMWFSWDGAFFLTLADRYRLPTDGPPGDAADRVVYVVEPRTASYQ